MSTGFDESARCANKWSDQRTFVTIRACLAFHGYALYRSEFDDGPVTYFAERNETVERLKNLAAAWSFLHTVGGLN